MMSLVGGGFRGLLSRKLSVSSIRHNSPPDREHTWHTFWLDHYLAGFGKDGYSEKTACIHLFYYHIIQRAFMQRFTLAMPIFCSGEVEAFSFSLERTVEVKFISPHHELPALPCRLPSLLCLSHPVVWTNCSHGFVGHVWLRKCSIQSRDKVQCMQFHIESTSEASLKTWSSHSPRSVSSSIA
jgi:hypothetical protein